MWVIKLVNQQKNAIVKENAACSWPSWSALIKATPFVSPPGWSEGKKTGWRGATQPPGLEKKINRMEEPGWQTRWRNWFDRNF